jgi:hypothetical protein
MADTTEAPGVGEVADLLAELCDIGGPLARFDDVTADELAAFESRKRAVLDRIDPGRLL